MLWLLQALELNGRDDVFTIYIGDDTTDEDAFEVRRESHSFETVGSRRTTCICEAAGPTPRWMSTMTVLDP